MEGRSRRVLYRPTVGEGGVDHLSQYVNVSAYQLVTAYGSISGAFSPLCSWLGSVENSKESSFGLFREFTQEPPVFWFDDGVAHMSF